MVLCTVTMTGVCRRASLAAQREIKLAWLIEETR